MKIGILYIATGRYIVFWEEFFKTSERYFLPHCEKHYFVFTDSKNILVGEETNRITRIYQEKLGWPYDTLMRFEIFLKVEKELEKMDYIFFFNANMKFLQFISEDFLPLKEGLLGVKHPGFYQRNRKDYTYETNPNSWAYMKENEGEHYFMGGLNGGKAPNYLLLIRTLNHRIKQDLEKKIIALWHDESHLNKYFWQYQDDVLVLNEQYGTPEGNTQIKNPKIIIRDKSYYKYGGHDWLRGKTNKKITKTQWYISRLKIKMKTLIKKIFRL